MKKILLAASVSIGLIFQLQAQTVAFTEKFDGPAIGGNTTSRGGSTTAAATPVPAGFWAWNDTNATSVSAPMSYHVETPLSSDTVIYETPTFSTVGNAFVLVSFFHKALLFGSMRAEIFASNNNGTTWTRLGSTHYSGTSTTFPTLGYFNITSYPTNGALWGTNTAPLNATNAQWVKEEFNVSSILGTGGGSAQCKLRFVYKSIQGNILPSANWNQFDGWYVDDVEVVVAPCEVFPPNVTFTLTPPPVPCYDNHPQGPVLNLTPKVGLNATDPSGIQSAVIHYSINGGAFISAPMTVGVPAARREFQFPAGTLALGDTVDYYVVVTDASCVNNQRRMPQATGTYYTFWTVPAWPTKCGTAACGTSPTVIQNFPWTENFESSIFIAGTGPDNTGTAHRGTFPVFPVSNWEISPSTASSGFGWSIRQGTPPNTNTGPSGDNTSGTGKFIYLATAQTGVNSQLITPCVDLRNISGCVALEFFYHKFGNAMGNLRVDIDTSQGNAIGHYKTGVLQIAGQTQTTQNAPWTKAFLDLTPYIGQIIRLRFVGTRVGVNGNMAIDDLRIYQPDPVNIEMTAFIAPQNGFCTYSNAEDVVIQVKNLGCLPISNIPVAFELNGVIFRDTIPTNLISGGTTTFTFGPKANLSAYISHTIRVFSEAPNDSDPTNNQIGPRTIVHDQPIGGFPYILDFDGPTAQAGNFTFNNPGNTGTSDWSITPPNTADNYSWFVGAGLTPTNNTGPFGGYQSNNYLYTEGNYGTAPASAVLLSRCVDMSALNNPFVDFFYHFYGADAGALVLQVKPENSNSFTSVGGSVIPTNTFQTDEFSRWALRHIDLSAYANQVVQLRIVAQKTGSGAASDIAIDKIQIYNQGAQDAGIIGINQPGTAVTIPAGTGPQVVLQNYGSQSLTSIPLTVTVTPVCGGASTTINHTWTGTLAPGASANFTLPASPVYIQGSMDICVSTNIAADNNAFNNQFCTRTTGLIDIQIPFSSDFESCVDDEYGFSIMGNVGTGKTYRLWGKKDGAGAHSGTKSWKTNPSNTGLYRETSSEALRMPRFIGFDSIMGAEIRFWHRFDFGAGDGGRVEFFALGQWNPLGDAVPLPSYPNWYANSSLGAAQIPAFNDGPGFAGNSGGWVLSSYPLAFQNNNSSPLAMRFISSSNASANGTGWEIDDFEIYVPPQYSAAPVDVRTVANLPFPGNNQLIVRTQNTGARPLDSCNFTVWINNTLLGTQKLIFSPPLARGRSRWDTIQAPWLNAQSGNYNVCMYTSQPNGRSRDDFRPDDSLCLNVVILDVISNIDSTGYCNDFEDPAQTDWLALNYATYADGLNFWQKGTPAQAQISSAFSGNNAWMTNLTGNYRNRDSSALFTPVFQLESNKRYKMEFMHNYYTERFHDGGTVDISTDGGLSWKSVGNVQGGWFNTHFVTSLDVIRPGWTNRSNGWVPASLVFEIPYDGPAIFRYRFGSDNNYEFEGWAIDDFCFKLSSDQLQYFIGLDEGIQGLAEVGDLYPNPASSYTQVDFNLLQPSEVAVRVYDMLGKVVYTQSQRYDNGAHTLSIPTASFKSGFYVVGLEMDNYQILRKLIIQ